MRPPPHPLDVVVAHVPLLVNRSTELGSVVGLGVELAEGRGSGLVLVSRTANLLSGSSFEDSGVVARAGVAEV